VAFDPHSLKIYVDGRVPQPSALRLRVLNFTDNRLYYA
jgi:hypothetical protein